MYIVHSTNTKVCIYLEQLTVIKINSNTYKSLLPQSLYGNKDILYSYNIDKSNIF